MVTLKSVEKQLKRISFNHASWNRAEALELPNILMPGEEIFECVNGMYEGGFALLCATNVRLLLVDKKPLKFLTVEDMRFDMINQIDYSHRLFGAQISISAGSKNLRFRSYNQQRLRKLIGHIQDCMADAKKQQSSTAESQQQHLEKINQQLQAYLFAQQQQQEQLREQLRAAQAASGATYQSPEPVKPPTLEAADNLYAQSLLRRYWDDQSSNQTSIDMPAQAPANQAPVQPQQSITNEPQAPVMTEQVSQSTSSLLTDLYAAGRKEIFGKHRFGMGGGSAASPDDTTTQAASNPLELNPLRIAYSKLPMVLRDRNFAHHTGHHSDTAAPIQPGSAQTASV